METRLLPQHAFPAVLALSRHQCNAFSAYLQVGTDALTILTSLLHLGQAPYTALFSSDLNTAELACWQAACADLGMLFAWGYRWLGDRPIDRRASMVREHLNDAQTTLMVLFESTPHHLLREAIGRSLRELVQLKRHV
jgi:hypothetical protein